jgi:hypothetical protein
MAQDVYFLKFLIRQFIFRKSKQIKYKKIHTAAARSMKEVGWFKNNSSSEMGRFCPLDLSIDRPVEIFFIFFIVEKYMIILKFSKTNLPPPPTAM